MIRFLLPTLCFLSFFGTDLYAQVRDTLIADTILKVNTLEEVEVRAMYSNIVTRRFPATVYAVSSNAGDIILPINMNESLNRIPSVYAHTGTFNTSRITMRGIGTRSLYGTRKINALLNDIPLTSGEGDTFIDDIDLQFIDRMEAVGGPTAGIYGPALGGSLLLYTKPAGDINTLTLNSGAGSYGTLQNAVTAEIVKGNSAISLMYKNVHSDGYRQNNNYNRNSALLNYRDEGDRSVWNILALFTDVKAGIPSSIDSITYETNPRAAASTWARTKGRENTQRFLAGVTHQYTFSQTFSSSATIYGLYKKTLEVRPFNYLLEDDRSGGIKVNLKKKIQKVEGLSVTPGFSLFMERYRPSLYENIEGAGEKGAKIAENVEDIFQANAFLIADYVPDLKNYFSLSFNVNKFGINDRNVFIGSAVEKYRHKINFSPRLSVSRQVMPNHFLFGSLSHGLSYPAIAEILYPDGTINNDVRPENAWSFEAGLKGIQLLKELKYSLAFYYMPVKDLIVPDRIAEDTYIGKNIGKSLHTGMEISVEKALPVNDKSSWFYLGDYRLTFNWQSNKFQDFFLEGNNIKGNELPGVPETRLFASLNFRIKNWFFVEPEIYMNGKTAMNDENTRYYRAYNIANLRFGFIFEREQWNIKLSSAINNLPDEKYASMILINAPSANNRPPRYYYPGLPRNYFVSVAVGFRI